MSKDYSQFRKYRNPLRRWFTKYVLGTLTIRLGCRVEINGRENIPKDEPVLVVFNHFHFADSGIAVITLPWYTEYIAGTERPTAPNPLIANAPDFMWGTINVKRGTSSRYVFEASEAVLAQNGILAIFIEGGAWADVLRPPRPGTSLIAVRNRCKIVPVAIHGMETVFQFWKTGRRGKVTVNIGEAVGPFEANGRGKARRQQLDQIADDVMLELKAMLPERHHGVYSDDPEMRAEAQKVADYPWETKTE